MSAKVKFYGVRKGKSTGIFTSWEQCKAQVHGFPGAEYKSFQTKEEAEAYMKGPVMEGAAPLQETVTIDESSCGIAYVDGSYRNDTKEFSYGVVFIYKGKETHVAQKVEDNTLVEMRNVAGEIKGAEAAMKMAQEAGCEKIMIYHDYEGIAKWCLGEWKTNKAGTKAYKRFFDEMSQKLKIEFVKVKGHSNDQYNDLADALAKRAIGL